LSDKLNGWKKSAVATAAVLGLLNGNAYALSLGRITVQSSLGEPLRAEIEVSDITADEAAYLKATIASPDAFSSAGLHYNAVMSDLRVKLQRQAGGRVIIGLSSQSLITDPFLDLLIEATWASGRIIREYTVLFDRPTLEKASNLSPTPAQVPAEARQPSATAPITPAAPATPPPQPAASAPFEKAGTGSKTPTPTPDKQQVKAGDTASAMALRNKPANISLDQMLVALLRANPNAFVGNNVNRLKTGALVAMPTAAMAGLETKSEASQILVAQSLDFNDYRRKLAAAAPKSPVLSADRKASGTLQTKVEDKRLLTPTPDKLTLSKGGVKEGSKGVSPEANIAAELAAKDSAGRAAEIAKNISDLSKLNVTSNLAAPPPQIPASAAASSPSAASLAVAATPKVSAPIAAAPAPKSSAAAAPKSSPSWLEALIKNPYTPVGAVSLMAALAGFAFFRHKQRNKAQTSILGEHLEPETHTDAPQVPTLTEHPAASDPALKFSEDERSRQELDLDLDLDLDAEPAPEPSRKRSEPTPLNESIDLALPDLDIFAAPETKASATEPANLKPKAPPASSAPIAASTPDLSALDFELGLLSLDLGEASGKEQAPPMVDSQDPLETKLALAHEFSAIGDEHGARALIEEVIAEASGAMKTKAELAFSQLQVS